MGVFEDFKAYALTATVPPVKDTLTFTTSAFWKACPDCGAPIRYVQFGGPRVGYDDYPGFIYVTYECRADYYFDDRKQHLREHAVFCPSTTRDCQICDRKIGRLVCRADDPDPFCSERCAAIWARSNVGKAVPGGEVP